MSFTYNIALTDTLSQVRFLCNDTDTSTAQFQDEEINGLIGMQQFLNVYPAVIPLYAAADLLEQFLVKTANIGKGIQNVRAGASITVQFGASSVAASAIQDRVKRLRLTAGQLTPGGEIFRTAGNLFSPYQFPYFLGGPWAGCLPL